jgi:hypothetical protein
MHTIKGTTKVGTIQLVRRNDATRPTPLGGLQEPDSHFGPETETQKI